MALFPVAVLLALHSYVPLFLYTALSMVSTGVATSTSNDPLNVQLKLANGIEGAEQDSITGSLTSTASSPDTVAESGPSGEGEREREVKGQRSERVVGFLSGRPG